MSESSHRGTTRLRLVPALVIAALEVLLFFGFREYGATVILSAVGNFGVPVLTGLAFVVWWMVWSRAPWRDRAAGLVLFLAGALLVVFTQANPYNGAALLGPALLFFVPGMALLLLLTAALSWPVRRCVAALFLLGCFACFAAMKVDYVGENFTIYSSWRWQTKTEGGVTAGAVSGTATLPAQLGAGDWPAFRGPARDGVVAGLKTSGDWSTPLNEVWRRPVGAGHSSMVIVGDVLFTQEQSGDDELVTCYSALTGEPIWVNSTQHHHNDVQGGEGPRATPAYANGKVYAQSAGALLQCLDAATGKQLWKQELTTKENPNPPNWGFSSSPLLVGDLVIQHTNGAGRRDLVAFNAATGEEVWSAMKNSTSYSSPQLDTVDGQEQVLMLDNAGLHALDPVSGKTLWMFEHPKDMLDRCVQPVPAGDGGFMLGMADSGSRMVRVQKSDGGWHAQPVWENQKHDPYFYDNVFHEGYFYGFHGNRLSCLDAATGETKWAGKRYGGQLVLLPEMDVLIVLSDEGKVAVVKAEPAAFTEITSFEAIQGKTWNHPAIAHGKLYVRNSEAMVCYELPGATHEVAPK
jgi:outer membrane protein assembly factor BamB